MKTPNVSSIRQAADYLEDMGLTSIVDAAGLVSPGINDKFYTKVPYKPDLIDLARLHRFVIENKRTTILEVGTGWSTWVLADALSKLKLKHADEVSNLRRNNPFELHVVDDEPHFINIAKERLPLSIGKLVTFHEKASMMGTFNDRICTYYESLPCVSPDLIYVDGPNQFNVSSDIGGWSTRHKDMLPMAADLLRIEHFFIPGTIVIFDGRAANARFFKTNIQRGWDYQYDVDFDQHVFVLNESPLGPLNANLMGFWNPQLVKHERMC